jgi:anti-sigma factor RsiW
MSSSAEEFKKMLREEEPETPERAEAARRRDARRKNHEWAEGPIRRIDLYRAAVLIGILAGGAYAELAETESPEFGARIDIAILTMESIVNKLLKQGEGR